MSKISLSLLGIFLIFQSCSAPSPSKSLSQLIDEMPTNTIIEIDTYDSSDQVVHPDILFSNDTFYLAITPYPYYKDKLENPSIYFSKDGISFTDYTSNPLTEAPPYDHNCDPDLFYDDDNKKCIYYLETMRPDSNNIILLREDENLKFTKSRILSYKLDSLQKKPLLLSPSVIKKDNSYFMYYVNYYRADNKYSIEYLSTNKIHKWKKEDSKKININLPSNYSPWHLDVITDKERKNYYMLVCGFYGEEHENNYSIILAKSKNMKEWFVQDEVLNKDNIPDEDLKYVYRSTGIIEGNKFVIWYSYVTKDNEWKLALKKTTLK